MKCVIGKSFYTTVRGIDYCHHADMLAVTSNSKVLLLPSLSTAPSDKIIPEHGFPALVRFGHEFNNLLVSDNAGPIDVFDLQSKISSY